jgi:putative ABC transport system permease protein
MRLNGRNYKIVGIMPKGFQFPVPIELWVPLALGPAEKADRAQLSLSALGRLKPGISVAQARAALDAVSQRLRQEYPQTNGNRTAMVLQLRKELYLYTLPLFLLLQAAAVFVLALACANLTNLYFVRMIGRQKEIAVRTALGADRGKLAAGIGLAIGIPVSVILNRAMASLIFGIVTMNPGILAGFSVLLLVVALAAAFIPARRAMHVDPIVALRYE